MAKIINRFNQAKVYEPDRDAFRSFTDDRQFHSWMRNDDIGGGYDPVIASLDKTL